MQDAKQKINIKKLLESSLPIIIFLEIMVILTVVFLPYIKPLATEEGREAFKDWARGLGFGGWLITLGIQLLQIFVALIPGEPVEIMLGVCWGSWGGMFTCLLGIFIGTTIIYFLAHWLGMSFIRKVVGTDDLTKYKFLRDKNKVELTVFILFFIPGTPKDALTYIAPIAPIHPVKYILIATFARIPSIITSTILGDSVVEGNYILAIVVFVITAIISVLGIIFGNKYIERRRKKKEAAEQKEQAEEQKEEIFSAKK